MRQQVKGTIISSIAGVYFIDNNQRKYDFFSYLRRIIRNDTPIQTDTGEKVENKTCVLMWRKLEGQSITTWESEPVTCIVNTEARTEFDGRGRVIECPVFEP